MSSGRSRLVILGTGWGSYSVLKAVQRKLYDVTVVSPRNHFLFTPLLASTTVGTLEFRSVIEPIRNSIIRDFRVAKAVGWDTKNQVIKCQSALKSDIGCEITYDKLVIGIGMLPNTFGIKGVEENACFLKEISDARKIRNRLLANFELCQQSGVREEEKRRLLHTVIVGGGPTGIEFGAELHDFVEQDVARLYSGRKGDVCVTLIEGKQILSSFDERLRKYAEKKISSRKNFNLVHGTVAEVRPDCVVLTDQTVIPCGLTVWSTGLRPREFTEALPDSVKNTHGQILVDEHLRVVGDESGNSFALGDCSSIQGTSLPPTAQVAEKQGRYIAKELNYEAKTGSKSDAPFKFQSIGMLAYIGGSRALSDLPEVKLKGVVSWFLWRSAYLSKLTSWRQKMQVLLDWTKTNIYGRDVSRFE